MVKENIHDIIGKKHLCDEMSSSEVTILAMFWFAGYVYIVATRSMHAAAWFVEIKITLRAASSS